MKFGVTADFHLTATHPERETALTTIVEIAEDESLDYLLIAGDLFDASVDIEPLKPRIRELFSGNSFQTYTISGNHDRGAYRTEDYFGPDIEILTHHPFECREFDEVTLVGVPYFDGDFRSIVPQLIDTMDPSQTNILLLHCTLAGHTSGFGEESPYLPVTPETLLELPVDYVCAGHVHSAPTYHEFGDLVFVYPGSPTPVSRSETGRRGIWIIDTSTDSVVQRDVPTRYYEHIELSVRPDMTDNPVNELTDRLAQIPLDTAHIIVTPTGFMAGDERAFFDQLEDTLVDADPLDYEVDESQISSVATVIESDLYQAFKDRLSARVDVNQHAVDQMALTAFSRVHRRTGE